VQNISSRGKTVFFLNMAVNWTKDSWV